MSQHDFDIANQTASNARADINNALKALASTSSGATAPSTTFADQLWYDTGNNQLKKRNEANSAWITLGTINEGTGKFTPNAAITTSEIAAATLVTEADTIATNDNDTTIPTSAAVFDALPFKNSYVSADTTISSGGRYVFTHGLGGHPSLIDVRLVCATATEQFSIGDHLPLSAIVPRETGAGSSASGVAVRVTSTQVIFQNGSADTIYLVNESGATSSVSVSNFKVRVRAWL